MNIRSITIGNVESMEPQKAISSLADTCRNLAQLIVDLDQEVEALKRRCPPVAGAAAPQTVQKSAQGVPSLDR